jgi:quercetin dioxygenase-like cupin family protein
MKKLFLATAAVLLLCRMAGEVGAQTSGNNQSQVITRNGSIPSAKGGSDMFTGQVRLDVLFTGKETFPVFGANVTFEAGARTKWHIHERGQQFIVISGVCWTQEWGGRKITANPGDTVWCPPGVKHWHGASSATAMTHLALTPSGGVQWLEEVTDAQYNGN